VVIIMGKDIFNKCYTFKYKVDELKKHRRYFFYRNISSIQGPEVKVNGKSFVMLGSNNYLGLTEDRRVKDAAIKAIKTYGTGCAGSRLLNGSTDLHTELEETIARFFNKEAALVFATGMQANLGCIQALLNGNSLAILDKYDHASIIDGCKLAQNDFKRYPHNDMKALELLLHCNMSKEKLIIIDGVFSMEGDIADLPTIISLAEKYNARVMVDDAHGVGVLGKNGKGTTEYFGLMNNTDIIMGTFSKSLAAIGGFIVSNNEVIEFIKHVGRSILFSASLPPPLVAAAKTAFNIIENEPERREWLWENTKFWIDGLKSLGYDTGQSTTPIVPIIIGDEDKTYEICQSLEDLGVFVNPVAPPAVPPGRALLRTSLMATHTKEHLTRALDAFAKVKHLSGSIEFTDKA
jgi:8-amino-7-oxononanoate synthase